MMLDLAAAMEDIAGRIRAQGVRCVIDERDVNPPAVLLRAPELAWRFGGARRLDATWTAVVVVENTGRGPALNKLGEVIEAAAAGIRSPILTARPVDVTLPDSAAPVPGYELSFTTKLIPGGST